MITPSDSLTSLSPDRATPETLRNLTIRILRLVSARNTIHQIGF